MPRDVRRSQAGVVDGAGKFIHPLSQSSLHSHSSGNRISPASAREELKLPEAGLRAPKHVVKSA